MADETERNSGVSNRRLIVSLSDVKDARRCLKDSPVIHSPLIPFNVNVPNKKIYLKCENLQPFRSFKARGACYAISKFSSQQLRAGICGASAGNFAQSLGYMAKQFETTCEMLVPDHIPATKLSRTLALDVKVKKVPFSVWWDAVLTHSYEGMGQASFIHPCDYNVMAGHGSLGLEILEDLPHVDTIICPYGSGGLITGIASALKQTNPQVKILACEVDTAAPVKASLQAGKPVMFKDYQPSFVDGMGGKRMLEEMWPYVSHLVDGSVVVSLQEVAKSIKDLMDVHSMITEGAGAASLAAALSDEVAGGHIVCVLSGGNIDNDKLAIIAQGLVP